MILCPNTRKDLTEEVGEKGGEAWTNKVAMATDRK